MTIPIAMLLIFVLLYFNFHAVRPAVLIFLNVPLAATGGILALWSEACPSAFQPVSGSSPCSASPS